MGVAFFAGGCFWGIEAAFQQVPGILHTSVGYMGGHTPEPTYQDVCTDTTGHAETVAIEYDKTVVSYRKLLEIFFSHHNPTEKNRQGPDIGSQYRSVIFYATPDQQEEAIQYVEELKRKGQFRDPIVTEIVPVSKFWLAEEYHQSYFLKLGRRYGNGLM